MSLCRNCGLGERQHTDAGVIYAGACDFFEPDEEDDEPELRRDPDDEPQ